MPSIYLAEFSTYINDEVVRVEMVLAMHQQSTTQYTNQYRGQIVNVKRDTCRAYQTTLRDLHLPCGDETSPLSNLTTWDRSERNNSIHPLAESQNPRKRNFSINSFTLTRSNACLRSIPAVSVTRSLSIATLKPSTIHISVVWVR